MATVSDFVKSSVFAQDLGCHVFKAQNILDFSQKNVASADVVKALIVPANCLVNQVHVIVKTAVGSTCTATVGDSSSATGWDASTNLNATAGTMTGGVPGTDTYATSGKFYASADYIALTMNNAATAGVVIVEAECVMIEGYA